MLDLAARIHYKVHFDIEAINCNADLLAEVAGVVWNWLQWKYKRSIYYWNWTRFCQYGQFETEEKDLFASTTSFLSNDTDRYWACKITEYQQSTSSNTSTENNEQVVDCAPRTWVTEIGYEQTTLGKATISFVVYYIDKAGFVGSLADAPNPTTPRIVNNLLSNQYILCKKGDTALSKYASPVTTGTADELLDIIMNPNRGAPILLMIPRLDHSANGFIEENPVNPTTLMSSVVGNALVFYAKSATLSEEMSHMYLPQYHTFATQYVCRPGQIRLYMPYPDPKNPADGSKHRYLRDDQIRQLGVSQVISIFRRVLSQDLRYYESKEMFRMEDCEELYRKSRQSALRQKYESIKESATSMQTTNNELEELLDMADLENARLRRERDDLQNGIESLKSDNWSLENQVSIWKQRATEIKGKEEALNNLRSFPSMPRSPRDVAMYFVKVYHDSFDFSQRGLASLDKCITKCELLWECFFYMATVLASLYRNGTPNLETVFRENSGGLVLAPGEGAETRKDSKFRNLRKDKYEGRPIYIEPHVKKGNDDSSPNCVRIYFCFDEMTRRIVVGHVGCHLDNYSTRSVK